MTTREKIQKLIDEMRELDLREVDGTARGLVELYYMAQGFGLDPLSYILPTSDADADQLVDGLITLALQVRGDDLAPYDFDRHVRDATATD